MGVSLVMFTERGERREFPMEGEKAIIGRTKDSDIQVALPEISRRHCELSLDGDTLMVRDLGSSNGTFVDNRRVQEVQLSAGQTLTVGPVVFTVVVDGVPEKIRPVKSVVSKKKPARAKKSVDETGGMNLHGSDDFPTLDLNDDDEEGPLAELAVLSKQKSRGR